MIKLNEACDFCIGGTNAMPLHSGGYACQPCTWRIAGENGWDAPIPVRPDPQPSSDDEAVQEPVTPALEQPRLT